MSRVRTADLGGLAAAAGLDDTVAGRFQRVIPFSLPTGGVATGAAVSGSTVFNLQFLVRDVDATASGAPEPATLETQSGGLALLLPVARRVRYVRLVSPDDGDRIAAFRFDGPVVSEDAVASRSHGSNGALLNVTDAALILRRRNGGDTALVPNDIAEVELRYTALNPRVALRVAGSAQDVPFPTRTNSEGAPVFPTGGSFGTDLRSAMTQLLAGLPTPLPDPLNLELILSADEPCSARIDHLDLSLDLETPALEEKAVLRFTGPVRRTQSVALDIPSGVSVLGGSVAITVSGGAQDATEAPSAPVSDLPATSGDGLDITPERPIAAQMTLTTPQAITAAECLLAAPAGPVELRAVLRDDDKGRPGDARAESEPLTLRSASPVALSFAFRPEAVPQGPIWLGLESLSGTAVALLQQAADDTLVARGTETGFALLGDTDGRGLVCALRSVAPKDTPDAAGGLELRLGATTLSGIAARGTSEIDLSGVLPAAAATGEVALNVSTPEKAVVTVAPVMLRYAVPD